MPKHFGICALCGKECELTYEHIPPRSAFNSNPAKMYSGEKFLFDGERLPWDFQGLKYVNRQKGSGKYSLCQKCNNITGALYGDIYKEIAYVIAEAIEKNKNESIYGISIEGIFGSRFIKQVLSMFCSVNDHRSLVGYLNPTKNDDKSPHTPLFQTLVDAQTELYNAVFLIEELRAFVLDQNAIGLDKRKFKLCMYITNSDLIKTNAVTSVINFFNNSFITVSEITVPPLGFLLYLHPTDNLSYTGIDITALSQYGYDEKVNIEFPFQILEMNTYFTNDYRTREQIEKDKNAAMQMIMKNKLSE